MRVSITQELLAKAMPTKAALPQFAICGYLDGSGRRWIESETELSPEQLGAIFYNMQQQEFDALLNEKLQAINGRVSAHLAQGLILVLEAVLASMWSLLVVPGMGKIVGF
ncbi:hypothetical protein NHP190003_10440 [Helicobacter sp. NHP19-003]|uniref:Uncharacterized protein n=1 Tax=Helicobacter gastrocanis TaxID=2849641 RepID=A0ABM7SAU7_9HELI|nr:hypothetical protein [Helicobacter sp. NHP19-003]BCZ17762.1 hypothetical protein NHP190003_10440 [Helicobacter sp. NHP19-003]